MGNAISGILGRTLACGLVIALGLSSPALAGDWTIAPSLSGQEIFTDNVLFTPYTPRSDFITTFSPSLMVSGRSDRLKGVLNYSPTLYAYARTSSLDTVRQNLFANGTAVLVPNLFFLDARGYASELPTTPATSLYGQLSPALTNSFGLSSSLYSALPKTELTQATSFTGSPYLAQRFGDIGTGELRYTVTQTNFSGRQSSIFELPGFAPANGGTLTNEGTASFLTGNTLLPMASQFTFDTMQRNGSGDFSNSSHNIVLLNSAYAINRRYAVLGSIGYEDIHFQGLPPIRINDVIWAVGLRATPNPDSSIVVRYGHQSGITGLYAKAHYAVTPRTTLLASYREGLSTSIGGLEDSLASVTLSPQGETISTLTGLPATVGNTLLGLQSGVYRSKRIQGQVLINRERDNFSVKVYHFQNTVVSTSVSGTGVSERATGGNAIWVHGLTPLLRTRISVGYASMSFPASGIPNLGLISGGVSLSYLLARELYGWMGYYVVDRTSVDPLYQVTTNSVFVGLSKKF